MQTRQISFNGHPLESPSHSISHKVIPGQKKWLSFLLNAVLTLGQNEWNGLKNVLRTVVAGAFSSISHISNYLFSFQNFIVNLTMLGLCQTGVSVLP